MSKSKKLQQFIYKIDSNLLEKKKWDITLSVEDARKIDGLIVALADSQVLSWINELNGTQDYDEKAKVIKREIKWLKKQPTSRENKIRIAELLLRSFPGSYRSSPGSSQLPSALLWEWSKITCPR